MLLPAVIEAKIQQILQPLAIPRPVAQPPLTVKPKLNFSTHPSAKQLSPDPSRPVTLASQRNYGSESNLLDSLSSATDDHTVSGDSGNWLRTGMRAAGSVPDLLSPRNFGNEPPPLPPERPLVSSEKPDDGGIIQSSYYDTPGTGDAFYNTPPVKHPHQSEAADFYNVPPTTYPSERDNIEGACYDVPPTDISDKQSAKKGKKKQSKVEVCEVTGGDVYSVPPSHTADDSRILAGSPGGEFYENVPTSSGKKLKKGHDAGRAGSPDNQKSISQTALVCITDQTYDVPSAEQQGGVRQSPDVALSASGTDETYDTPIRAEVTDKKKRSQKQVDKQSVDMQPLTGISDQMYDTPPTSSLGVKTRPDKPLRGKPRSSLEPSEAVRHSEQLSGQETYDTPPAALHPSAVKSISAAQSQRHTSAVTTDDMYDVPPLKSAAGNSFSSVSGAANTTGLNQSGTADDQTYNVPASFVPPVPSKRHQATPPPKPPRPSVRLSALGTTDTSVSSTQEKVKFVDECETSEKDTVSELPTAGSKGLSKVLTEFL